MQYVISNPTMSQRQFEASLSPHLTLPANHPSIAPMAIGQPVAAQADDAIDDAAVDAAFNGQYWLAEFSDTEAKAIMATLDGFGGKCGYLHHSVAGKTLVLANRPIPQSKHLYPATGAEAAAEKMELAGAKCGGAWADHPQPAADADGLPVDTVAGTAGSELKFGDGGPVEFGVPQ